MTATVSEVLSLPAGADRNIKYTVTTDNEIEIDPADYTILGDYSVKFLIQLSAGENSAFPAEFILDWTLINC